MENLHHNVKLQTQTDKTLTNNIKLLQQHLPSYLENQHTFEEITQIISGVSIIHKEHCAQAAEI